MCYVLFLDCLLLRVVCCLLFVLPSGGFNVFISSCMRLCVCLLVCAIDWLFVCACSLFVVVLLCCNVVVLLFVG